MVRSVLFVLGSLICAYLQARVLPELGFDRLVNLPLLLSALFATPYQLPSRLAGATAAGLALDALFMRPFGVTPLALSAAVIVGSALRSDLEGWPRRFAAAIPPAVDSLLKSTLREARYLAWGIKGSITASLKFSLFQCSTLDVIAHIVTPSGASLAKS